VNEEQKPSGPYPQPDYPEFERRYPDQQPPASRRVAVDLPTVSPVVTYVLLGLSVLVFLLQMASQALFGAGASSDLSTQILSYAAQLRPYLPALTERLGGDLPAALGIKINELIALGELWRLFTPMLLHGSLLHIGFNMYALFIFGPGLERHFGHARFLALYILSGFAGNVASLMFSAAPSLGSSTAIFGLLGAQGVFLYQNREMFGGSARRALNNIISIAVINLIIGLSPGIDNWGHMGGLVGGTLFAWFAGPLLGLEGFQPQLSVVDKREDRDIWIAGALVGLVFALLAAGTLYLRGR
jgi:rhomboid protease GluP